MTSGVDVLYVSPTEEVEIYRDKQFDFEKEHVRCQIALFEEVVFSMQRVQSSCQCFVHVAIFAVFGEVIYQTAVYRYHDISVTAYYLRLFQRIPSVMTSRCRRKLVAYNH